MAFDLYVEVSMESGLEYRNNRVFLRVFLRNIPRLNGVRPRRPEQFVDWPRDPWSGDRLNGVRPRRPEQ